MSIDVDLQTYSLPDFKNIIQPIIRFLEQTPLHDLPPDTGFTGIGIYALYYRGDFDAYQPLLKQPNLPIYVGKAELSGKRKGGQGERTSPNELYNRLRKHSRSIESVSNLSLTDFQCRFVIFEEEIADLIVPTEAEMIRSYHPLWNTIIDGFGNNDPGAERYNQILAWWDTLHPGRSWTAKWTGLIRPVSQIEAQIAQVFEESD